MSNVKGDFVTDWADGQYTFRLTVNGAIELEQKCEAPFAVIFQRLTSGQYKIADIREAIRLGLIGGGMVPSDALKLTRQYVDDRPLAENWPIARAILGGLMFGFEVSPLGKQKAAPETDPSASTPPPSTPPPRSSGSRLSTLMPSRFGNSQP